MRVLITTELEPDHLDCLVASFPEVDFRAVASSDPAQASDFNPEVLFCVRASPELLDALPALRWIHARSAGVEHLPLQLIAERGILLTNGRGAHGVPVSETALAMMLAFATGLPALAAAQRDRAWVRPIVAPRRFELEGQTLLVVGLGDLGGTLVRKARGIGMRVVGCDRARPSGVVGLNGFVEMDEMDVALREADHVALCLPLTDDTRGLMSAARVAMLKRSAYLYNVGRGGLVDQSALVEALAEGKLAGAGLDVTEPEPLPPDHPLWGLPNVILTQHVAGASPHNSRRVTDQFSENLHRYQTGYPLLNLVDPGRGY